MNLKHTPLYGLHEELGAKLVPFAGYAMPVSYPLGIMKEHLHTRSKAGLFDVSHMGQVIISGPDAARRLETLVPVELEALAIGQQTYALFTNESGGVIDDLMITRQAVNKFFLVINADCKARDLQHLRENLQDLDIVYLEDHGLLALQGPAAKDVIAEYVPDLQSMSFMQAREAEIAGIRTYISRSGYSGEDGFEISVAAADAEKLARILLAHEAVEAVGLGARDSLRLEAGLCLYGHELNDEITPIEANLNWSISKSRRMGGEKEGGFPGADIILKQMQNGVSKKRVGLLVDGRIPVREGAQLTSEQGNIIGKVSSGGFAPTMAAPIAIAFVDQENAQPGQILQALVRNKVIPVEVCRLPFVPQNYYRA